MKPGKTLHFERCLLAALAVVPLTATASPAALLAQARAV
jgi:hypothetical protein